MSAPSGPRQDEPVLTWTSEPSTSVTLSWFDQPEVLSVVLQDPSGAKREVPVQQRGPVGRVNLDGLEPSAAYLYRVIRTGGDDTPIVSDVRSFTTAPAPGEYPGEDSTLKFAVVGDIQPFNEETRRTTRMVTSKVASLDPDFFIQVGDVTEWGSRKYLWRQSFGTLSAAAATSPLVPVAGNHDYFGVPDARFFKEALPAPYATGSESRTNIWYSLSIGPVHIAVLDTEAKGTDASAQMEWLDRDLAAARAQGMEWLFIAMHRPAVSTSIYAANPFWAPALVPIAARYGVAAIFWGHDHLYEHYEYQYGANGYLFSPDDEAAARPIHLFTVGTSGARVDPLYAGFFHHAPRSWSMKMYNTASGSVDELQFNQRAWNADRVYFVEPGIRYQDPAEYPGAASYYSWPFETAADAEAGTYSDDPSITYSDALPFFGYSYGETSIHYLWVEVTNDRCTITAHYADGPDGEQGTVISHPDGRQEVWTVER